MTRARMQQTIAAPASVAGFGYWSGDDVRIEFRPAAPYAGITFVRCDLVPNVRIPARVEQRIEVPRRTNLQRGSATVDMVEHVLAALFGLGIDNCEVWTDRPEMPGCDGSSAEFVRALNSVGLKQQGAVAELWDVAETIRVAEGDAWIEARPATDGQLHVEFQLDYPDQGAIGRQTARVLVTPERFAREIAPCRTFLLQREADQLRRQGLGARVTNQDLLVFNDHGPVDNALRFADECARHKALDVIGDLALGGRRLAAEIVAHRSGHRLHAELTRQLNEHFDQRSLLASA